MNLTTRQVLQRSLEAPGLAAHYVGHDGRHIYLVHDTSEGSHLKRYKMR